MTRFKQVLISALAMLVVAAVTAPGAWADSREDYSPPAALLGAGPGETEQTTQYRGSSIAAIMGPGEPESTGSRTRGSSPTAILGARGVPETPVNEVTDTSGFDWGAAFIGAGAALTLTLIAFGAVSFTRRRQHATVPS